MLDLFRTCISDEDMIHLYRVLYDKAMKGDVSAAKLVLAYKIGKPAPCPDPDAIDRDEWEHYQQDAVEPEEARQVLGSLPSRVGNDIARTALPIMTEARTRELAAQLKRGIAIPPEGENRVEDACKNAERPARLPFGNSEQSKSSMQAAAAEQAVTTSADDEPGHAPGRKGSRRAGPPADTKTWPGANESGAKAPLPNGPSRKTRGRKRSGAAAKNPHRKCAG
jgi:hypothetical protein